MSSFRALSFAFTMSIAVHAFFGYAMTLSGAPAGPGVPEPIQIDYVRYEKKEPASAASVSPSVSDPPAQVVRKKVKGIQIPRVETPAPKTEPTDFQKAVDEKIKKQLSQLRRLEMPSSETRVSSSMTSAELIADPVKGSIFVGYFGQVKKKIQNTVFQKAGRGLYGHGSVCLGFVLNASGELEHVTVLPKGTDADVAMQALAVKCIKDSAPFGGFPKDLGPRRIYFNITIFFDAT